MTNSINSFKRGRSFRNKRSRRKWATGKRSRAISDRDGFEYAYKDMVVEPGTGLLVHRSESDGVYNLVDHPQNFPADVGESIGLRNPRTDVVEPQVLITSASGSITVGSDGLPFFIFNRKNIHGVSVDA